MNHINLCTVMAMNWTDKLSLFGPDWYFYNVILQWSLDGDLHSSFWWVIYLFIHFIFLYTFYQCDSSRFVSVPFSVCDTKRTGHSLGRGLCSRSFHNLHHWGVHVPCECIWAWNQGMWRCDSFVFDRLCLNIVFDKITRQNIM